MSETFIDLEFDTGTQGGAQLGDIASSLVTLDELLRDLGSIAAYPSSVEFRSVQIVAIEMRNPLKIKLSLSAIPAEAVRTFQEICRDVILSRERRSRHGAVAGDGWEDLAARRLARIKTAMTVDPSRDEATRVTEQEAERLHRHIATLQNAEVPLRRVEVKAIE